MSQEVLLILKNSRAITGSLVFALHPDRGGSQEDMRSAAEAKFVLDKYAGQQIPGGYTPPPKPEPKPERAARHWGDVELHSADKRTFGEWLHKELIRVWDLANDNANARNEDNLFNAINKMVDIVSGMRRAFSEWKWKTRTETILTEDDFYNLLETLEAEESPKSMRAAIKRFKEKFMHPFYDKYIKEFPPEYGTS